jgi:hypothetical protein
VCVSLWHQKPQFPPDEVWFRAIASGEFIEEQIYNWTYSDEQRAKRDCEGPNNPHAALPRMSRAEVAPTEIETGSDAPVPKSSQDRDDVDHPHGN